MDTTTEQLAVIVAPFKKLLDHIRDTEDCHANDGDGYFDTWQSTELEIKIKRCDDALAALEALESERDALKDVDWQPIETAPKDGKPFMAITDYGFFCLLEWTQENGGEFWRTNGCRRCDTMGFGGLTHWRPLPEPPAKGGLPHAP